MKDRMLAGAGGDAEDRGSIWVSDIGICVCEPAVMRRQVSLMPPTCLVEVAGFLSSSIGFALTGRSP